MMASQPNQSHYTLFPGEKQAISTDESIEHLVSTVIPKSRDDLIKSSEQLLDLADYCQNRYDAKESEQVRDACITEAKQYTVQALASVAYTISVLAQEASKLLSLQGMQLERLEENINYIGTTISIHEEKKVRRLIGSLSKPKKNKPVPKFKRDEAALSSMDYTMKRSKLPVTIYDGVGYSATVMKEEGNGIGKSRPVTSTRLSASRSFHSSRGSLMGILEGDTALFKPVTGPSCPAPVATPVAPTALNRSGCGSTTSMTDVTSTSSEGTSRISESPKSDRTVGSRPSPAKSASSKVPAYAAPHMKRTSISSKAGRTTSLTNVALQFTDCSDVPPPPPSRLPPSSGAGLSPSQSDGVPSNLSSLTSPGVSSLPSRLTNVPSHPPSRRATTQQGDHSRQSEQEVQRRQSTKSMSWKPITQRVQRQLSMKSMSRQPVAPRVQRQESTRSTHRQSSEQSMPRHQSVHSMPISAEAPYTAHGGGDSDDYEIFPDDLKKIRASCSTSRIGLSSMSCHSPAARSLCVPVKEEQPDATTADIYDAFSEPTPAPLPREGEQLTGTATDVYDAFSEPTAAIRRGFSTHAGIGSTTQPAVPLAQRGTLELTENVYDDFSGM